MKKEVHHRKGDQKIQRNDIDLEARKPEKKHERHSFSPSPSTSFNDDSDENKYRNNEGKECTDSRFRVVSEEDQHKYSLTSRYGAIGQR